jgi:hypothetical protein
MHVYVHCKHRTEMYMMYIPPFLYYLTGHAVTKSQTKPNKYIDYMY